MNDLKMDRVRGTLVGQFVGDALGTTLEFKTSAACRALYPQGLTEVVGGGPFSMQPGQVTDDGELALALARTLVRFGVDADQRARAYAAWMNSNPPDRGVATSAAFGDWPVDVTAGAMLARAAKNNGAPRKQANGAMMRVSPIALYAASMTPERAGQLAMEDARFSHPSEVCQQANAAFVRAIHVGIHGGTPKEGWEAACSVAKAKDLQDALADIRSLPSADGPDRGWVLKAVRIAFHQLLSGRSFEDALVSTIMVGGDTDTNGAITGALLGSFYGLEAIPARWWGKVQACRPPSRPAAYHAHDALQLATLLVERGVKDEGKPAVQASTAPAAAGYNLADAVAEIVRDARGQIVPHERNPSYRVAKIPLVNWPAARALEHLLGGKVIRGSTNYIMPLPKAVAGANEPERLDAAPHGDEVRTSRTHPINVDWLPSLGMRGRVGITFAPGKHSRSKRGILWQRDLVEDLERLKNHHGIDVLVCLLEDQEMARLRIPDLPQAAEARGLVVRRLPIPDGGLPPRRGDVEELVEEITRAAQTGKSVVIHCQGGLGRAGTVGGCYLRARGMGAEESLQVLVQTRGRNCPENDAQRTFIRDFR